MRYSIIKQAQEILDFRFLYSLKITKLNSTEPCACMSGELDLSFHKCFPLGSHVPNFFGIVETEKDKVFNPTTHSSTRLFKKTAFRHARHKYQLPAGLSKDQRKLFNVVHQIITCVCYDTVKNFIRLHISF